MNKSQPHSPISTQLRILSTDTEELERQNNNLARLVGEANNLLHQTEQAFEEMGIQEYGWDTDRDDNPVIKNGLLHQIREYLYS